jgi:hypothetical protein
MQLEWLVSSGYYAGVIMIISITNDKRGIDNEN